jgi:hypothetical protein
LDPVKGNYAGTVIDRRWWRRYRRKTFFARGSGRLWLEEEGLFFLRYLTRKPLFIPFPAMTGTRTARWHAGRWGGGRDFLVIDWRAEGLELSSGFLFSKKGNLLSRLRTTLEGNIRT